MSWTRQGSKDALRQQNDLLNRITNTAPSGIIVRNPQGQITFANAYAQQKLKLTLSESNPQNYNSPLWQVTDLDGGIFPEELLPFRQVISTRRPVSSVHHAIQFPGEQRIFISANAAPIFSPDGQIESIVTTLEDITEQIAILQAHQESEERYRRLVELSPDAIIVHSEGHFVYINPAVPVFVVGLLVYNLTAFVSSPMSSYVTAWRYNSAWVEP